VKIDDGILYEGTLTKKNIGLDADSLVLLLNNSYPKNVINDFFTNSSWLTNWYLTSIDNYSIGLGAFVELKMSPEKQRAELNTVRIEIDKLGEQPDNEVERQRYDQEIFSKMHTLNAVGVRIVDAQKGKDNPLSIASKAGAKAKNESIAQIASFMGPQDVMGRLMNLSEGIDDRPLAILAPRERSFLAYSFATSNLLDGISPEDEQIHLASARVGPVNINEKASETGYLQRRMVKGMEGYIVAADRTVRNRSTGVILEYVAGESGLNPENLVKANIDGVTMAFPMNPSLLAAQMNAAYGL
jgi:DNA-directed RNA polymerase II subunit RPB1